MTEDLLLRPSDVEVTLLGGGTTRLAYFRGQKVVVHFCPAAQSAGIASFDALREEFAAAGTWLVTADPADRRAFQALAAYFPDFSHAVPEDGATFVIDRDGVPRYVWPGFDNAQEALLAACARP